MSAVGPVAGVSYEMVTAYQVDVVLTSDFVIDKTVFGAGFARRLYVGTGGTVIAQMSGSAGVHTYANVPSGSYLDGQWTLVKSTANGTTASGIVAEF